jgi:hypothetical protein
MHKSLLILGNKTATTFGFEAKVVLIALTLLRLLLLFCHFSLDLFSLLFDKITLLFEEFLKVLLRFLCIESLIVIEWALAPCVLLTGTAALLLAPLLAPS